MKTLLVIMLLAGFGDALAQDTKNPKIYNDQNKYQGYGVKRPDGNFRVYDKDSNFAGQVIKRPDGSSRVYSKDGKFQGTVKK